MTRPRLLYIDVPFEAESGGDKNRSRFLWQALRDAFDVDLLLIQPGDAPDGPDAARRQIAPVLTLAPQPGPWYHSASVPTFDTEAQSAFNRLLSEKNYDLVLTRFHSPWELACLADAHPSRPAVVVDLDMMSSRLVSLTWQQKKSFRNRWFLFEKWKLEALERRLFRKPFLVLFSNPTELERVRSAGARLAVLPNVMPDTPRLKSTDPKPVILFFGSMNSSANTDGFRFLMESLLPRMENDLRKHNVRIHVVGKHPPAWIAEQLKHSGTDRVALIGEVDSMERAIADSRFVFLPLRIASGTRTRILEAAAQSRAVVTTTIGAEGIEVEEDALVQDEPEALANAVRSLLEQPDRADDLGRRLHDRCVARYSTPRVARDLVAEIQSFLARRSEPRQRKGGA
jgi:glycosyltransferase involved in cell wall biosynthesis